LLIARVFALTKPQLLTFTLFSVIYNNTIRWLHWAHQIIVETRVYRLAQQLKIDVKKRISAWFY
jgi:hypothetical protein